ncbi:hypothetical protein ACDT65_004815 [Salmonella enterica subsp. enterica]|nr:hypothetical protein [Salmonella enterica subsp. enterica]
MSGRIAAKTETQHTFVNGAQNVVIFWIYYPLETRVYYAKKIFFQPGFWLAFTFHLWVYGHEIYYFSFSSFAYSVRWPWWFILGRYSGKF